MADEFLKPSPPSMGSWWLRSRSSLQWNRRGRGLVGGGGWQIEMPDDAVKEVQRLRAILGDQPADLEFGYKKD